MPRVTSAEVGQYLGLGDADQLALKRLLLMLQLDNWALGSSGSNEDSWYVMLGQDIWRFQDVQTIEDCLAAREAWFAEGRPNFAAFTRQPVFGLQPDERPVPQPVPPASSPYVHEQVVEAIRIKGGQSKYDVTKLLALIGELNDNYADWNTYASHALLRAILDHIPPILGCSDFKGVVNNYAWGRTDKNYIKRLAEFRDQADDALHRQISTKPDVLAFEHMPTSVCIDRLLQECAQQL